MITVKQSVQFKCGNRGRKLITEKAVEADNAQQGHIPRISRLMALAIKFDGLIQDGTIFDQSELARLAHVTQPRMTQIMNLLHLAPDIQERLLFLPCVTSGRDPIHEKMLRPISAQSIWCKQRKMWCNLIESCSLG